MTTCQKIKYPDKAMARTMHKNARDGSKAAIGHVYKCPRCGYWHTTHHSKAEWRRITKGQKR